MLKSFKHKKTLHRVLFSYIIVFLIPTLILALFVHVSIMNRLIETEKNSISNELEYARLTLDSQLSNFTDIVNTIYFDDELSQNMLGNDLPSNYKKFIDIQSNIKKLTSSNELINELILYVPGSNIFVSTNSSYMLEHYLNMVSIDGISDIDEFYDYLNTYEKQRVLFANRRMKNEVLTMYVYSLKSTVSVIRPTLLFVTTDNGYRNALAKAVGSLSGAAFATDMDGRIISYYCSDPDVSFEYYHDLLMSCSNADEGDIISVDGNLVSTLKSESGNIKYSIVINEASIMERTSYIRYMWFGMVAVVLLFGLSIAILLGKHVYRPLGELRSKANAIYDNGDFADDFTYLSSTLDYMDSRNELLQNSLDDINNYLVFRLLKGAVNGTEEISYMARILGVQPYNALFRVLIIESDGETKNRNIYSELLSSLPDSVSILMMRKDGENAVILAYDKAKIQDGELPKLDIKYQYSSGSIQTDIQRIPISYAEAYVKTVGSSCYVDLCASIKEALKCKAASQVKLLLHKLCDRVTSDAISIEDAKLCAVRYLYILSDTARSNNTQYMLNILPDAHSVLKFTKDKIDELFIRYNYDFIEKLILPNVICGEDTNTRMIKYLENHYNDFNFSFQQMAEDFKLTLPVLSKQFLEANNQNLTDYMAGIRIDIAKRLLSTTKLSVNEVAMEVGYYNVNSFIRRFKQITEMTPGRFRAEYSNEE